MKVRTIITQDAEIDDQNSLRHFLLVCNQVEVQGIVQTSSIFHWQGVAGTKTLKVEERDNFGLDPEARFDRPWRWPGTDWMEQEINDYEKVYPNLVRQAEGYPTPDYLRSIIKVGNIGYMGEMEHSTEGSNLIKERLLDVDPRKLYLQVWGGTNTIARALKDIEEEYRGTPDWENLHDRIEQKVVITACGEQDTTYRGYIAEEWPGIQFVKCLQMGSYAYPWRRMPAGPSFDSLTHLYMKSMILCNHCDLIDGYATWMDGKIYEGEGPAGQFGQPEILKYWFGHKFGLPDYEPYDFLSEGDSPTYFCLMDWGFRTLENFAWGGISGRYVKTDEHNSKGEPLNYYTVTTEDYTSPGGTVTNTESMWRYVVDLQNDFAARAKWCVTPEYKDAEHAPVLQVREKDITAGAGEEVWLQAAAYVPDAPGSDHGSAAEITWRIYREAGQCERLDETVLKVLPAMEDAERKENSDTSKVAQDTGTDNLVDGCSLALLRVPADAKSGDTIHVIAQAMERGPLGLTHYAHVIVTVV